MERNDKHKLDRILREHLHARPQPPDAELWRDIERQLDKRSRRGFFFRKRYLMILLLLAGLGGTYSIYRFNVPDDETVFTQEPTSHSPTNRNEATPLDEIERPNNATENADYASQNNSNNIQSQSRTAVPPTRLDNNTGSNHSELTHKQNPRSVSTTTQTHQAGVTLETLNTTSATAVKNEIDKQNVEVTNQTMHDVAINKSTVAQKQDNDEHTASLSEIENGNITQPSASAGNQTNQSPLNETPRAIENTVTLSSPDAPALTTEILQDVIADSLSQTEPVYTAVQQPGFNPNPLAPKRWQWFIAVQTHLNHVSKNIADDGAWPDDYGERRKREEKATLAWSQGLRFGVDYKRFVLQSGVGLRSYAERIEYNNRSRRYLVRSTMHYTGDTTMLAFATTAVSEVNNKLDVQNGVHQNRYVEFPLMLGFRFGNSNVSLTPSAGVAFAKPMNWSSRYINRLGNDLENPESAYGLNPLVKSFVAELSFGMALSSRLRLDASGAFQAQLESVFKSAGPDQRYRTFGGGVGLRYAF
ncbi:MAG TPA: hypothetical protein VEY71_10210 [Chitinophagales bacterium]|nr:hypothetical protein [Chitinophagales bacterium]